MILDRIVRTKERDMRALRSAPDFDRRLERVKAEAKGMGAARDFKAAISNGAPVRIIAEVKKASPSKGLIRPDFDAVALAREYEENGASAISVLTDSEYFQGSTEYLSAVVQNTSVPVLRKDFMIDPYQFFEARALGADAVLLIVAILDDARLTEFLSLTEELGMSALVEVHDEPEMRRAIDAGARIIGVNNRDLKTFITDTGTTARLAPMVPKGTVLVSESGINTAADIKMLMAKGVDAFLIGESLAREADAGAKLRSLIQGASEKN